MFFLNSTFNEVSSSVTKLQVDSGTFNCNIFHTKNSASIKSCEYVPCGHSCSIGVTEENGEGIYIYQSKRSHFYKKYKNDELKFLFSGYLYSV